MHRSNIISKNVNPILRHGTIDVIINPRHYFAVSCMPLRVLRLKELEMHWNEAEIGLLSLSHSFLIII